MLKKINQKRMEGFTLIELLIVMAVLGVLAVVVLIAINPAEQLARARDSGKVSGVQQLGRAVTAYYVGQGQMPPDNSATWIQSMVDSQDLAAVPADPAPNFNMTTCGTTALQNDWCLDTALVGATQWHAVVYTELEAQQYVGAGGCSGPAYAVFSTYDARGGWGCAVPVADANYNFR